ncbi:Hypothetical protein GLP15_3265 [Giardia lamblia P15]|uniref:Uncharacterized protein n=1 Tax=Giardia intestinalis (strain P15) TaxID=658858 RepID=E1EWN7_GIAIA|nr:Hypothetical protein GLP15_3265 [Giardia lamblia P15]
MNQTPTLAEPSSCIISPTVHGHEPVLKRNISYEDALLSVPDLEPDFLHEEVDSPIITTTQDIRSPIMQSSSPGLDDDVFALSEKRTVAPPKSPQFTASDYHSLCRSVFQSITFCSAFPETMDLRKVTCSQKHLFFTFDISVDHLFMLSEGCYTIPEEY